MILSTESINSMDTEQTLEQLQDMSGAAALDSPPYRLIRKWIKKLNKKAKRSQLKNPGLLKSRMMAM